uniref:Uncharacterized protein n=1 Tax=Prymnesium polylepis TaxID=72548 RepID=A0A6T7ZIV2_9EUKA
MTDDSAKKSTDKEEKAPMVWCSGKLGAAVTLSGDQRVCSRSSTSGWGVQLASEWLTKDIHTVALACEQLDGDAFIGVVGRNFYPSDWDVPLSQTKHAVAMDVKTGRFTHKGANTSFVLRPVKSGARLNVVIDMQIRELTIELLDTKGTIASSITVEGIPGEVAVAVSFGPGRHAVRLVGNETEKPAMKLLGKLRKDLWDDENVIAPMALNVKKGSDAVRGSAMRVQAAEMAEAMMLE